MSDGGNPLAGPRHGGRSGDADWESNQPYRSPVPEPRLPASTDDPQDQSVFAEPWLRQATFTPGDTSSDLPVTGAAAPASHAATGPGGLPLSTAELAELSVWDEPATSAELSGTPAATAITWFRHYERMCRETPPTDSAWVMLAVSLTAGPLAVLGTFWASPSVATAWVMTVVFGPTIEELLKLALPLWIVEKKPWLFRSDTQILVCGIAAGLAFAAVENGLYLTVYLNNPSASLVVWRWTVCVALHATCSLIGSIGVVAIRRGIGRRRAPPQLADGAAWLVAAIVTHGLYNAVAIAIGDRI